MVRLELGDNIFTDIYLSSTTVVGKAIEFSEKKKKSYYADQGHSRLPISVSIESLYRTSYQ